MGAFKDQLSRVEWSFATELRDTGNNRAHSEALSADDTYRALDTMALADRPAAEGLKRAGASTLAGPESLTDMVPPVLGRARDLVSEDPGGRGLGG